MTFVFRSKLSEVFSKQTATCSESFLLAGSLLSLGGALGTLLDLLGLGSCAPLALTDLGLWLGNGLLGALCVLNGSRRGCGRGNWSSDGGGSSGLSIALSRGGCLLRSGSLSCLLRGSLLGGSLR